MLQRRQGRRAPRFSRGRIVGGRAAREFGGFGGRGRRGGSGGRRRRGGVRVDLRLCRRCRRRRHGRRRRHRGSGRRRGRGRGHRRRAADDRQRRRAVGGGAGVAGVHRESARGTGGRQAGVGARAPSLGFRPARDGGLLRRLGPPRGPFRGRGSQRRGRSPPRGARPALPVGRQRRCRGAGLDQGGHAVQGGEEGVGIGGGGAAGGASARQCSVTRRIPGSGRARSYPTRSMAGPRRAERACSGADGRVGWDDLALSGPRRIWFPSARPAVSAIGTGRTPGERKRP